MAGESLWAAWQLSGCDLLDQHLSVLGGLFAGQCTYLCMQVWVYSHAMTSSGNSVAVRVAFSLRISFMGQ